MGTRKRSILRRRTGSLAVAGFGALLWLVLAGCGATGEEGDGPDSTATANQTSENEANGGEGDTVSDSVEAKKKSTRERTTSVSVTEVIRGDLVLPILAEGRIRARSSAEIRSEIAGRCDRVLVQEGSRVRKGTTLIRLDGREYEVAIAEARSRYLQALSLLMIEEEEIGERPKEGGIEQQLVDLWDQERLGKITRAERLERERNIEIEALKRGAYRHDLVEARTGIAAARADEERGRLNLERTEIRAPFTGVITGLDTDPGERVTAGQLICTLVDNVTLEAEVGVLESDLRGLRVGRRALLAIPALVETLDVTVDVISPTIDATSRTCGVLLRFKNDSGRLRPGMFARALIAGEIHPDRLLVPREAILTRDGRPLLFRIDEGRAKWVYVNLGLQNDHVVEIASVLQGGPLKAGSDVIVTNHLTLTDDAKVKIKKRRGLGDPWLSAK